MFQTKTLPFGDWLPDQPGMGRAISTAINVIPQAQGYRTVKGLASISNALDSTCLGAAAYKSPAGQVYNFAGDAAKLYSLSSATYSNVSRAANYVVTSWEFAKYGSRVLATAVEDVVQYYDMGVSALFANLPGSPPQAAHIGIVGDFVVLGNLIEGATSKPAKIAWSGFNNSETWASNTYTQADSQELLGEGGAVQRIVGGEYGVIFQENSIRRMEYVGPPFIFQIREVEPGRGTNAPNSVCFDGTSIWYWGYDGFYLFNGQESIPIGSEKVDRFMAADLDPTQLSKFRGAVDRINGLILWTYPSSAVGRNRIIVYNSSIKKWALIDQNAELLFQFFSPGYNLDQLDPLLADIDSASISVDSTAYQGGIISLGAFDSTHKLAGFTGSTLTAQLETGDLYSQLGSKLYIDKARSLVETTSSNVIQWASKELQSDSYNYGTTTYSANAFGEISLRKTGRYQRLQQQVTAASNQLIGIEISYREAGKR